MKHRYAITVALLAATLAAAAAAPSPATAGEYPVYACEPAFGDVNHSWFAESNNSLLAAYTACPVPATETRAWNQGLVARESVTSGPGLTSSVPQGSYSAMRFSAPPGAGISRWQLHARFCGYGSDSTAGLFDGGGFWWRWSGGNVPCTSMDGNVETARYGPTPSIAAMVTCLRPSCQINNTLDAWATIRSATVWVSDSTQPAVSITGGSITAPGWHRGNPSVTVAAGDNVGIRRIEASLDGKIVAGVDGGCDWTVVVPCSTPIGSLAIESTVAADGVRTLAVAAQDSAGNWGATSRQVQIDNTPPPGPLDLDVAGGQSWQATNRFDVRWTNPPQVGQAPIAGVSFAICPAANRVDDYRGCTTGSRSANGIAQVAGVSVPAPGDWVGRFWLTDQAGNTDRQTARSIHLRYDPEPPALAILDRDAADPQRIAVAASDGLSGLAGVDVEIRREGSPAWISLPVTRDGTAWSTRVDDSALPGGPYDVRARARDLAGNERSSDVLPNGEPATMTLPLRIRTRLVLGAVRRTRDRRGHVHTVLKGRAAVRFGRRARVQGTLTSPGGNPVAAADLQVFQRASVPGAPWRRVGVIHTGGHGGFSYNAQPGPSRLMRFDYPGTPLVQPSIGYVRLKVHAATSFHVNRRLVVNGDDVMFRGRVLGRVPKSGKLVQLQAYSRGTWRTFATARARGRTHRWGYAYRFSATRGVVRYRFRAVVPAEAGFPYIRGVSRRLRVTVRGL